MDITRRRLCVGKALREIQRDKYYLSTKVGRYGKDGVNTWDYSARRATESVYESMERLGVDHIDLINVHDIEFADLHQVVEETFPALVALRDKGVVGHVGITDLQLENLQWVIDHVPPGTVESILNFCHFTLNDDKLLDYLDYFEQRGIGVINASPLSMGLLLGAECRHGIRPQRASSMLAVAPWSIATQRAIRSRNSLCSIPYPSHASPPHSSVRRTLRMWRKILLS